MASLLSIIVAIGNTPLVALDRLCRTRGVEGRILEKLDYPLPGFSRKTAVPER